uniref:Uncharacterized protein n=1 Tax=Rhizophora mucronata TaxID=61149 RepID=A0A2P2NDV9_RHIMU
MTSLGTKQQSLYNNMAFVQ